LFKKDKQDPGTYEAPYPHPKEPLGGGLLKDCWFFFSIFFKKRLLSKPEEAAMQPQQKNSLCFYGALRRRLKDVTGGVMLA
jgi:hypothetical protein